VRFVPPSCLNNIQLGLSCQTGIFSQIKYLARRLYYRSRLVLLYALAPVAPKTMSTGGDIAGNVSVTCTKSSFLYTARDIKETLKWKTLEGFLFCLLPLLPDYSVTFNVWPDYFIIGLDWHFNTTTGHECQAYTIIFKSIHPVLSKQPKNVSNGSFPYLPGHLWLVFCKT
jgi:hypothetical protein